MNDEVIKILAEECEMLFPSGYFYIQGRGCGKTFVYLYKFLLWYAYQVHIELYQNCSFIVTLGQAHDDIEDYAKSLIDILIMQ